MALHPPCMTQTAPSEYRCLKGVLGGTIKTDSVRIYCRCDKADDWPAPPCPVSGKACLYLLMRPDALGGLSPICSLDLDEIGGRCSADKRAKARGMLAAMAAGNRERRQECGGG